MFQTERIIIRKFEESDWKDLYNYLSKAEVVRYEPYEVYEEEESRKEAIRRSKDEKFLGVVLKKSNILIGNLYYEQIDECFNTWEIGYVFNSDYQRKGYATEAVTWLVSYIFDELKAHRIVAYCNEENMPSWRLLERIDFRREALFIKKAYFKKDDLGNPLWFNAFGYALLRCEYKKQH